MGNNKQKAKFSQHPRQSMNAARHMGTQQPSLPAALFPIVFCARQRYSPITAPLISVLPSSGAQWVVMWHSSLSLTLWPSEGGEENQTLEISKSHWKASSSSSCLQELASAAIMKYHTVGDQHRKMLSQFQRLGPQDQDASGFQSFWKL